MDEGKFVDLTKRLSVLFFQMNVFMLKSYFQFISAHFYKICLTFARGLKNRFTLLL